MRQRVIFSPIFLDIGTIPNSGPKRSAVFKYRLLRICRLRLHVANCDIKKSDPSPLMGEVRWG